MSDTGVGIDPLSAEAQATLRVGADEAKFPAPDVITIKEVRVLSGLSRGAALPLEAPMYIGADPECEIFLMDPGIADRHLRLDVEADGSVTVLDLTTAAGKPVERLELEPFGVGDVELVWCRSDQSWERPRAGTGDASHAGRNASSTNPAAAVPARTRKLFLIGSVSIVLILIAVIMLFASRSKSAAAGPSARPQALAKPSRADLNALQSKLQDTLRTQQFSQLSVETRDDKVLITGHIRGEQQQALETLIQTWKRENPSVRLALKLTDSTPTTLPFGIVAMVGGSTPSVLASTGESLYMGSESNGYRLVLVNGACLTFERIDTHQRLKECLDPSSPQR